MLNWLSTTLSGQWRYSFTILDHDTRRRHVVRAIVRPEGLSKLKKSNDFIGTRSRFIVVTFLILDTDYCSAITDA
jgi:hypothetical protein